MTPSEHENELNHLFRAYRASCDYGDADVNFMPHVWERIEARRSTTLLYRRVSRIFATGTAALAIVVATAVSFSTPAPSDETWVETLASDNLAQVASYYEPVHLDDSDSANQTPARPPVK